MKTIYKYKLNNFCCNLIEAPIEKFLDIQIQGGDMVVWAEVDLEKESKKFYVGSIGTGWERLGPDWNYLKTYQDDNGFVWHFYWKEDRVDDKTIEPYSKLIENTELWSRDNIIPKEELEIIGS